MLKQKENSPLSFDKQAILIYAGIKGYLDTVSITDVILYEQKIYDKMRVLRFQSFFVIRELIWKFGKWKTKEILILLYLLARWAEPGAVVLIDEPDLYLHPSLVNGLLSSLEKLVADIGGQLIITSHQPEIWQRYEASGKRIELGCT